MSRTHRSQNEWTARKRPTTKGMTKLPTIMTAGSAYPAEKKQRKSQANTKRRRQKEEQDEINTPEYLAMCRAAAAAFWVMYPNGLTAGSGTA